MSTRFPIYLFSLLAIFSWQEDVLASPLELWFLERPPYYVSNTDGTVSGIVASPVARAMVTAHIDHIWKTSPGARQLAEIERGKAVACGVGWFRNPKREEFAKFSNPIYRDKPMVALVRRNDPATVQHDTLRAMMEDIDLVQGAKNGFSYGKFADKLIDELDPRQIVTTQDHNGMARMLSKKRFDYLLIASEEAAHVIEKVGGDESGLAVKPLSDVPPGNLRYLMCSKAVPTKLIERFNLALEDG